MVCEVCHKEETNEVVRNFGEAIKVAKINNSSEDEKRALMYLLVSRLVERELEVSLRHNMMSVLSNSLNKNIGQVLRRKNESKRKIASH